MDEAIRFWDREQRDPVHSTWLDEPRIRRYVNAAVSGDPEVWPVPWLAGELARRFPGRLFDRGLSIGCGAGGLERDLLRHDVCRAIDAFDGSVAALAAARRSAAEAGCGARARYYAADFNRPALPAATYDVVFFHQSLHHVAYLEKLLSAVLRSLKANGVLYLDEYVGPSRFDWSPQRMAPFRALYETLPADCRRVSELPRPIVPEDPSEAIRSAEIERYVGLGFDVLLRRPYGGTLLSMVHPFVAFERAPADLVEHLIESERRLLASGYPSFYAVLLCRPKRGPARRWARSRYFLDPKLRRLAKELRERWRPPGRRP